MKHLMIHFSAILLLAGLLFVGCNKNETPVSASVETTSNTSDPNIDTPVDKIELWVKEYVKVTAPGNIVTYEYRPMGVVSAAPYINPISPPTPGWPYPTTYFTTPAASRYEGSNLVETQYYVYNEHARWHGQPCKWGARYRIDLASNENYHYLFETYIYNNEPCDVSGQTCAADNCTTSGLYDNYVTNFSLPPSTELLMRAYCRQAIGDDNNKESED
jgi:hypothetical protein